MNAKLPDYVNPSNLPKIKDPAIKAKWLEALRSGEYKQATGQLHKDGGFCCLGVLCDIVKDDIEGFDPRWGSPNGISTNGTPPPDVNRLVFGTPYPDRTFEPLTYRNDGELFVKQTFKRIADLIERNM